LGGRSGPKGIKQGEEVVGGLRRDSMASPGKEKTKQKSSREENGGGAKEDFRR